MGAVWANNSHNENQNCLICSTHTIPHNRTPSRIIHSKEYNIQRALSDPDLRVDRMSIMNRQKGVKIRKTPQFVELQETSSGFQKTPASRKRNEPGSNSRTTSNTNHLHRVMTTVQYSWSTWSFDASEDQRGWKDPWFLQRSCKAFGKIMTRSAVECSQMFPTICPWSRRLGRSAEYQKASLMIVMGHD